MGELWELPEGWKWVKLGEVADFKIGRTPPRKEKESWENGEIHWVSIGDMQDFGYVIKTEELISRYALDRYFKGTLIPRGTLLMSFKLTIGRTSILGVDAVHNEAIVSIFPKENIVSKYYLLYYLPSVDYSKLTDKAVKGDTLNKDKIYNIPIPLPPLHEQKRIVQKIESIMARTKELRRHIQEAKEEAQTLWKSALAHKFPQPGSELPEGWKWVKLGEVCENISNGITKQQNKQKVGYMVTRIETISDGTINISRVGYVSDLTQEEIERYKLEYGDILFSHINSEPRLGNNAIYLGNPPLLIHGMNLLRLRPKKEIIIPHFLFYLINSLKNSGVFISISQKAINQSSINVRKLREVLLPLPTLPEQKRTVQYLEKVHSKVKELSQQIKEAEEELLLLERSVLDRAFRGKL